ncbi:hypothetical protein NITMOv2_1247 [Nitrospira moscoviensis]|uniref:Uncharacterized protein n=1 Tax=Nitrospira moscoviensis TaxID=42253 RepID=A0A0K2G9Q8_NITMO|nr:hypothetical protein NITMOv2_1247 [Nitrospira moscoviensis]
MAVQEQVRIRVKARAADLLDAHHREGVEADLGPLEPTGTALWGEAPQRHLLGRDPPRDVLSSQACHIAPFSFGEPMLRFARFCRSLRR